MQNLPVSRLSTALIALLSASHIYFTIWNGEAIGICAMRLRVSVIGLASPLWIRKMERGMRFQDQSFPGPKPWLFRLWACGARSACPLYEPHVLIVAWCNGLNWHSEWCRPGRSVNVITQISVIACHYDKTKHKVLNRLKRAFHRYEHRWNVRQKNFPCFNDAKSGSRVDLEL